MKTRKTLKSTLLLSCLCFSGFLSAQNTWNGSTVSTTTAGYAKIDRSLGIGVTPNNTYRLSILTGSNYSRGIDINNN